MQVPIFLPRRLAKRRPEFNNIGWRIESWAIGAFVGVLRRMPLERATRFAHRLFATLSGGSGSKRRRRVVRNLLVAFPELTDAARDRLTRDIFGHVGVALAEIVHMPAIWRDRAARLEFVAAPEIGFLRERGKPAVLVILYRQPGANIIETVDRVRALIPTLKASIPSNIDLAVAIDRTTTIRGSLQAVKATLLIATPRPIDEDDLEAIRKAAEPLLRLLERRGLTAPRPGRGDR